LRNRPGYCEYSLGHRPGLQVTNFYGVRWNAPKETAYPSTFVLDKDRVILFERTSHSHGDRTTASEVPAQIPGN